MAAPRAVVLLSGGLDSATALALARAQGFTCHALSVDYGQRHAVELQAAARLASSLGAAEHRIMHVDLAGIGGSALTDSAIAVPETPTTGIPVTYVPARNTIMLSLALAWAEVLQARDIFIGVNVLDSSGYPDCRPQFIAAFTALAARELRRFVLNPVFLSGVAMAAWWAWVVPRADIEIDEVIGYPAIFLGGFGMAATYWLTRSMRASEPVAAVTPVTRPARTTALCGVAIVPLLCGVLTLFMFLRVYSVGAAVFGPFSPSARIAVLIGQIVVPSLGGPLLGVALGRWVRFPGAAFVLFLVIFGWVELVTMPVTIKARAGAP